MPQASPLNWLAISWVIIFFTNNFTANNMNIYETEPSNNSLNNINNTNTWNW